MKQSGSPVGMTRWQYTNYLGQTIDTEAQQRRPRSSASAQKAPAHKGWLALGYSPDQLQRAEIEHAQAAARAAGLGAPAMPPFRADAYMRRAAPSRIRSRAYEVHSAAQEACRIAERIGWVGCHTRELISR